MVTYMSEAEIRSYDGQDARFTLDVTDEELRRVEREIVRETEKAGFDRPPVDIYHD